MKKRVVVGMSGGVDSSVVALLLQQQGYDVIGLFMNNWEEEDENGCCTSVEDWQDVVGVCGKLGIPCYSVNFAKEYMDRVFKHFLSEYKKGRTPNPDVLCNREIKFAPFREHAISLGADLIATGHYCAVGSYNGEVILKKAKDKGKDQTYFLNQVRTEQLNNVIFPLGDMDKSEVRRLAEQYGLVTAKKKDSTGICFIGERNFKPFLQKYLPAQKGKIQDVNGVVVGEHSGLMYYTLGQRKGLGIGGIQGQEQARWYVVEKRLNDNVLVVSCGEGEELLTNSMLGSGLNIIGSWSETDFDCTVKLRYRQDEQNAHATILQNGKIHITYAQPQRAVTPGQYAVLYHNDRCLGGAVIDETFK